MQIRFAKLYGMLVFVCFGWQELKFRYCLESVSLKNISVLM